MEESSLDYKLIKTNRADSISSSRTTPFFNHESRISMKKSTFYVILLSVSIFLIGSEFLVYLLSSKNSKCQCVIPDRSLVINAKHNSSQNISPGATAPLVRNYFKFRLFFFFYQVKVYKAISNSQEDQKIMNCIVLKYHI